MTTQGASNIETARVHLIVKGRVQGVGFRAFVQQVGATLGLGGWVRNMGYDKVESVAEGPRNRLEEFIEAVRTGPRGARVDEIQIEWEMALHEFNRFDVRSSR